MKYKKLGDFIQRITDKNNDDSLDYLVGISEKKVFREPAGKVNRENLSNHFIVHKNEFAYIPRMNPFKPLALALSSYEHPILVSPSYVAFKVINTNILHPQYLLIYLSREEFDRYAAFNAWSSTRDTFDWINMQNIEIPLPPIEKQREYVKIYGNLLKLIDNHENSFSDLQLISNTFTENLVKQYGMKELGEYIQATDERNHELGSSDLKGISIKKKFIESKANMNGVSLDNYKVVQPEQFAYVTVTSRNGEKLSIALNDDWKPCVISSTYQTFKLTDKSKLLPEFLLLWFKRPEFDRYARYNSWGSARETFDWSEMQRVRLPVPPIEVQKSIVEIHRALQSRKKLTQKLKKITKEISPVLIKNAKDICMETVI
ncbi:MAG: restriction endonuclease subunit S [Pseudomonadales bacterium]|nr:restriction endonuclease subunit S [Pseudomonadales bacterium]